MDRRSLRIGIRLLVVCTTASHLCCSRNVRIISKRSVYDDGRLGKLCSAQTYGLFAVQYARQDAGGAMFATASISVFDVQHSMRHPNTSICCDLANLAICTRHPTARTSFAHPNRHSPRSLLLFYTFLLLSNTSTHPSFHMTPHLIAKFASPECCTMCTLERCCLKEEDVVVLPSLLLCHFANRFTAKDIHADSFFEFLLSH